MKGIASVLKIMATLARYAGVLIILGETFEYGYNRFKEKYGASVEGGA